MKLKTAAGVVTLRKTTRKQLERLGGFLPLAGPIPERPGGADYGIIMKQGRRETWAIKQQPVDIRKSEANELATFNQALVVQAIHRYLKWGFTGVLMPCVYLQPKVKQMMEVGIAYSGGADPSDAKARRGLDPLAGLDPTAMHGEGFGKMVIAFIECLAKTAAATDTPLFTTIDMDHRPRSAFDRLLFSFLIHGQDVYSLKINPASDDPVWTWLRVTGIDKVYALPSVPYEIQDD